MLTTALPLVLTLTLAAPAAEPDPALDAVAAEGEEALEIDPEAMFLATASPAMAEAFKQLDPDVRARLLALDEAAMDALTTKATSGAELSPEEQQLADALLQLSFAQFESQLTYQGGDVTIGEQLATLHLGDAYRFLGPDDAQKVIVDAWGNPPDAPPLGMIVPAQTSPLHPTLGWGVIITYEEDGHVEDDDADDIDYDELLENLQEATEQENPTRVTSGYPALHLRGWAEPPHYDKDKRSLYWAFDYESDQAEEHSLNYSIRVLGRKGVLSLNAVSGMSQLPTIKPAMEQVYGLVEYQSGNRYEDFDPDIDKIAAYGLGGLIAGKLAAKAGLFAVLLKFLVAAKKLVVIGAIALVVAIKALWGRITGKRKAEALVNDRPES